MRRAYLLWLLLGVLPAASCTADTPVAAPAGPTPLPIVSGVEVSEVDALWQSVPWEVNRYDGHIIIRSERATDYDQHELISLTFMDQAEPALVEAVAVVDSMGSAQRYTLKPSAIRLALFKYRGGIVAGDLIDALNRRVAFWVNVVNPLTVRNEGAEPSSSFELASGVVVQWRETQLQLLTGGDCTRVPIYLHAFDGPFGMEGTRAQRYLNLGTGAPPAELSFTRGVTTFRYTFSATIDCTGDAPRVTVTATANQSDHP